MAACWVMVAHFWATEMLSKEAALVRKGLFAIVLIAAAFAGGAAVNGPGLRWAKEFIWSKMPTEDENEDPHANSTSHPVPASADATARRSPSASPA